MAMQPITKGEHRHTHDHKGKRTKLLLVLRGHTIREWPWVDGMLSRKQIMAHHGVLNTPEAPKPTTAPAPVCLKIGSVK
jgi:hypothetical protein